ncbi:MAG: Zn-dependent hydrolase [Parvibaculaceae bacterium]
MQANGERLWNSIMEMSRLGLTADGGFERIALTDADKNGRDLFVRWCKEAGCEVNIDAIGNIFARRHGRQAGARPILIGSHLDTVPNGGRFDGTLGVMVGLEAIRSLNDASVSTERPIDIVVWTDEESVRFPCNKVGSAAFSGHYRKDEALRFRDGAGISIGDELRRIGYAGDYELACESVAAYFEVHIEQGPVLERAAKTIGIVKGAQGQQFLEIHVDGRRGHAGTVPMADRRDALVAAAHMICAVPEIVRNGLGDPGVATVGSISVAPNARSTIPGNVRFSIDARHPLPHSLTMIVKRMEARFSEIAADHQVGLEIVPLARRESVKFDDAVIHLFQAAARALNLPHMDLYSGAGHDACNLACRVPTGMIFVPCAGGISHHMNESVAPGDARSAADLILHAILSSDHPTAFA